MLSKSHWLTDTSRIKPGVLNDGRGLNYPHKFLQARWIGLAGENVTEWTVLDWEFDPTNLSFEHLLLSVTQKRAESVIKGFKNALSSLAKSAFSEEDLEIIEGCQDPTHKLSSIEPIYLEEERNNFIDKANLELQEKDVPLTMDGDVLYGKRNFEEIDDKAEGTSPRKRKLVRANAGARISYLRMKEQIKSHDLSFTVIQPDKSLEFIDPDSSISLTSSIPVLKMDRQSILAKMPIAIDKALNVFGDIYIRFVGSRLLTTTACSVISFKYDAEDSYIKIFLRDWSSIVMICQAASQGNQFVA
ncbi:5354_t:CDS:2, partial [Racocetra fulgida]